MVELAKTNDHYVTKFKKNNKIFDKIYYLCEGGFGFIYKAYHKPSDQEVVVKILKLENIDEKLSRKIFINEIKTLESLSHPNIIPIVYSNKMLLHFALPYAFGGDLTRFVQRMTWSKPRVELRLCHIFKQLVDAVCYLHENGVIHNDIKTDNVLLMTTRTLPDVNLTDFDSSFRVDDPDERSFYPGTWEHGPPEQLRNLELLQSFINDKKVDDDDVGGGSGDSGGDGDDDDGGGDSDDDGDDDGDGGGDGDDDGGGGGDGDGDDCGNDDGVDVYVDNNFKPCTTAVDIYNIGLCLYESMERDIWNNLEETKSKFLERMKSNRFVENLISGLRYPEIFSDNMYGFLKKCLKFDKDDRATAEELRCHQWFKN